MQVNHYRTGFLLRLRVQISSFFFEGQAGQPVIRILDKAPGGLSV
jgi:hypothetical protein